MRKKQPPVEELVIEVTESQFVYDNSTEITQRVDLHQLKTPVMDPTEECPFCRRWVIFRWIWSDYRFTLHAEPVETSTMGEMPGNKDCLGSFRPVSQPIRPTRQPLFLRGPVL